MMTYLKKNFLSALLVLILFLVVVSVAFTAYNRHVMVKNYELKRQSDLMKQSMDLIFVSTLRQIDLGLRGYVLTHNEQLLNPYNSAMAANDGILFTIDSIMQIQKLDSLIDPFARFKEELSVYLDHCRHMKEVAQRGDQEEFVRLLNLDKGYDLWLTFAPINSSVIRFENELVEKSQAEYEAALNGNVVFQVILMLLTVPTLGMIMYRLSREGKDRNKLLGDFRQSNRKYIFDPGDDDGNEETQIDARKIINDSTDNLIKASRFIKSITQGDYSVEWEGLDDGNRKNNESNLVGQLITMRDEMKRVNREDSERRWVTEGLAQFSELVRNNQATVSGLSDAVVRFLATYMKAQQASLFLLDESEEGNSGLMLSACYAFDKKKFIEKRIDVGSGMIGQVFMEGTTAVFTDLPQGYIQITSGLGDATPGCLVIVPMKYNDRVECVLEMASFEKFDQYKIQFLEKAGEFVASSIHSVKITEHTNNLLSQSHENMEMLRAQEEEMRQNMEELQATQEEMTRKEKEITRILEEAKENEQRMKQKLAAIEKEKEDEIDRLRQLIAVDK